MHAELFAIFEALSYIYTLNQKQFVVYSDSKSALQHLISCTYGKRGIPLAYTILNQLRKIKDKKKIVILQWVPAHVGIKYNEVVDVLAKEACSDGTVCECLPLYSDMLYVIKKKCHNMWREYFDERSRSKGVWYRTVQPGISARPWFDGAKMSRSELVIAFRLRSGHIPLNAFYCLMGKLTSPNCTECGRIEDVHHILTECVRIEAERKLYYTEHNIELNNTGVNNTILAFPHTEKARQLYKIVQLCLKRRM